DSVDEIDHAEVGQQLSRLRVQLNELAAAEGNQHAWRVLCCAGPIGHSATNHTAGCRVAQLECPRLGARVGIQRDDCPCGDEVHDVADDDGRRTCGLIGPRLRQL